LFGDAGADVVKLEPAEGDPLRRRSITQGRLPAGETGAIFKFLNAGKRSILDSSRTAQQLIERADLVILDGSAGWTAEKISQLSADRPDAVVVSISAFGLDGPYVDEGLKANEFILQALCGSTASRGYPEGTPIQAGGEIGEWATGSFAAVGSAAALRRARRSGKGSLIDVSMFESLLIAMSPRPVVSFSIYGEGSPMAGRSIDLPSIVPTKDGLVGFCSNTGRHFQDLLVLIGHPEYLDDADMASRQGRMRRRAEFESLLKPWAAERTTEEVVELASSFRLPVASVGRPDTVTETDHYIERGVFARGPDGILVPRPPYRSENLPPFEPGPTPTVGEHSGKVEWTSHRPGKIDEELAAVRPLSGLRVFDLTAFWSGPLGTMVLAELGADVVKVEGPRRPDGMRFSEAKTPADDRWWEWGTTYLHCNADKRDVTLDLNMREGRELALALIKHCDLLIENFSPRVMGNFGLEWPALLEANPELVAVRMPAFGLDGPWSDRVAFAQTAEQASGMAWVTGEPDDVPIVPKGPCDPIAGLHASFAAIAGLELRDRIGAGLCIESTMIEVALNIAAEAIVEYQDSGRLYMREGNRGPNAAPQGVYRCAGDDDWVALSVTDEKEWSGLLNALGKPPSLTSGLYATHQGRRAEADAIDAVISDWTAANSMDEVVQALRENLVPCSSLQRPSEVLKDRQLAHRGFWEWVERPLVGTYAIPALPMRFAGQFEPWARNAPPLYGQHNYEVLSEVAGLSDDEIAELGRKSVIVDRPVGA
jgi:crotonobetainyl-CoA:carnitine CoA-transferase CaiB-like acyl-CoA transferase